jgi:hypothetical protein
MEDRLAVLSSVEQGTFWRVRITWPNGKVHHIGKFTCEKDAVAWITAHPWLADRPTDVAEPRAADQPLPPTLARRPKFKGGRPKTQRVSPPICPD